MTLFKWCVCSGASTTKKICNECSALFALSFIFTVPTQRSSNRNVFGGGEGIHIKWPNLPQFVWWLALPSSRHAVPATFLSLFIICRHIIAFFMLLLRLSLNFHRNISYFHRRLLLHSEHIVKCAQSRTRVSFRFSLL